MTESDLLYGTTGKSAAANGGEPSWLGCSAYRAAVAGREDGAPPPVDLAAERRNGEFVAGLIRDGAVSAAHDVSDGGLAVALAEMAMAGGIGAALVAMAGIPHAAWFGEDQARFVGTAAKAASAALLEAAVRAGVPAAQIGETGGGALAFAGEAPVALSALRDAYENWLPRYMGSAA